MLALGSQTDIPTTALALAAAEAVVLAELARLECLEGLTGVNAEMAIRFENTANRSLRRLGLDRAAAAPVLTIAQQIAALKLNDDEDDDL